MNWLHSFYCVGAALTIFVATLAIGAGFGWRSLALGMLPIPALIGLLFFWIPLPPLIPEDQKRSRVRDLLRQRYFLFILAAIFFGGATEMGMAQWLPSFAELDLKLNAGIGGGSLLAFSVAMALGRMVIGLLNRDVSMVRIMIGCCATTAVLFLVAGFFPHPWIALAAAILSGFTGSCLWPSTLGLAGDRYPPGGRKHVRIAGGGGKFRWSLHALGRGDCCRSQHDRDWPSGVCPGPRIDARVVIPASAGKQIECRPVASA